jgi:hypothetical protein
MNLALQDFRLAGYYKTLAVAPHGGLLEGQVFSKIFTRISA